MQSTHNLAELWSKDHRQVFRLKVSGFEEPHEKYDWLDTTIEYQSGSRLYRNGRWEFNLQSLGYAIEHLSRIRYTDEGRQLVMAAPYRWEEFHVEYKKGYLKSRPVKFLKGRQGTWFRGKLFDFEFGFFVDRAGLLKFHQDLKRIHSSLPARPN